MPLFVALRWNDFRILVKQDKKAAALRRGLSHCISVPQLVSMVNFEACCKCGLLTVRSLSEQIRKHNIKPRIMKLVSQSSTGRSRRKTSASPERVMLALTSSHPVIRRANNPTPQPLVRPLLLAPKNTTSALLYLQTKDTMSGAAAAATGSKFQAFMNHPAGMQDRSCIYS